MANRGLVGSPDKEMFLDKPSNNDSPTIEPLRIHKREGASPEPRAGRPGGQGQQRPGAGAGVPPSYSPPPGGAAASSLPYPDFESYQQQQRQQRSNNAPRLPYPDDDAGGRHLSKTSSPSPPAVGSLRPGIPEYPKPPGQSSKPAERRGNTPKPLPDSPGPDIPDKEGLFQRKPKRTETPPVSQPAGRKPAAAAGGGGGSYDYSHQYFPPPDESSSSSNNLQPSGGGAVGRFSSTASTSTTRASRGSPPPPETPIVPPDDQPGGGIEARYAAAGIAGAGTLTGLQAQSAAAAQRAQQYGNQPPRNQTFSQPAHEQQPPRRPWTPTELPGTAPSVPPTVYQGAGQAPSTSQSPPPAARPAGARKQSANALEQDMQRLQVSHDPPPAYSTVSGKGGSGATTAQGYPNEKAGMGAGSSAAGAAAGAAGAAAGAAAGSAAAGSSSQATSQGQVHPAFANDQHPAGVSPQPTGQGGLGISGSQAGASPAPGGAGPASPPPLPEGWIAHMDPNSGQYYYIHLPTQSTQWEFPKGPTPLNLNEPPTSPIGGHFGGFGALQSPSVSSFSKPLASPAPSGYAESVMSMQSATPTVTGFTGPPPASGVDVYNVAPTNGVYFGPYLRYANMDLERGIWLGSILLVTDAPQPPTIHLHQSTDLSPNPRQLKAKPASKHQRWTFYRYDLDLGMEEHGSAKWTYAITSHLGCTRYEFLVAGRHDTNWRFVATSGNDFGLNVKADERTRLGGVSFMWKDIMAKHAECGGFHAQLGLGDQICADRLWKELPLLKQWLAMSGKETRKNEAWTAAHEESVSHAYFHYYTSHFDQPHLREAFAQIPYIMTIDDHDVFDGFGSYPEYMQYSNMFKNIGRIGIDTYLLFQQHATLELLRNVSTDTDIFTITGTGWHFVKYLGPAVAVVGLDCRSERSATQVLAGPTWQGIFPKVATLPASVQHCLWMIPVPVVYPRLEVAEQMGHALTTGKKAVTGAYNVLGRVTSSVAGVVGAKQVVGSGFDSVKRAVGKTGLMGNILSPFGDVAVMDELRDSWTHESKDLERTYLIRTLQGIAHQKSLRMTFLSGAVDCCGAGLVHDPAKPQDHKTMYQLISSAVVNAPPPGYLLKLLHNSRPLYVPANGHRTTNAPSDTKEDMMEIFQAEPDGRPREQKRLMGRRNYVAVVAYDPEVVQGTYGATTPGGPGGGAGGGKLSLAADFMVQGDGGFAGVSKYGPVIIPSLEFGR